MMNLCKSVVASNSNSSWRHGLPSLQARLLRGRRASDGGTSICSYRRNSNSRQQRCEVDAVVLDLPICLWYIIVQHHTIGTTRSQCTIKGFFARLSCGCGSSRRAYTSCFRLVGDLPWLSTESHYDTYLT